MDSKNDKIKGLGNQALGKVKEEAGKLVGNPNLEAEGQADQSKGHLQSALGNAKDAMNSGIKKAGQAIEKLGEKIKGST